MCFDLDSLPSIPAMPGAAISQHDLTFIEQHGGQA